MKRTLELSFVITFFFSMIAGWVGIFSPHPYVGLIGVVLMGCGLFITGIVVSGTSTDSDCPRNPSLIHFRWNSAKTVWQNVFDAALETLSIIIALGFFWGTMRSVYHAISGIIPDHYCHIVASFFIPFVVLILGLLSGMGVAKLFPEFAKKVSW